MKMQVTQNSQNNLVKGERWRTELPDVKNYYNYSNQKNLALA